jgi:hypothetical protein
VSDCPDHPLSDMPAMGRTEKNSVRADVVVREVFGSR